MSPFFFGCFFSCVFYECKKFSHFTLRYFSSLTSYHRVNCRQTCVKKKTGLCHHTIEIYIHTCIELMC